MAKIPNGWLVKKKNVTLSTVWEKCDPVILDHEEPLEHHQYLQILRNLFFLYFEIIQIICGFQ